MKKKTPKKSPSRGSMCCCWTYRKKGWCGEAATHEFRDKRSSVWHPCCDQCAKDTTRFQRNKIVRKIKNKSYEEFYDLRYEDAKKLIGGCCQVTTGLLQKALKIGWCRAAFILFVLERKGVVGPENAERTRRVLANAHALAEERSDDSQQRVVGPLNKEKTP